MRFWWVSDCNCSAPIRAYACCGVRAQRSRHRLAGYIGVELGCCQTKKSGSEMAEQRKRKRKSVTERFARACANGTFDPAIWNRTTD